MQSISGNTALRDKTLVNLSKDVADLKESLQFIKHEAEQKFSKINEKISTLEGNLLRIKNEIEAIQTTEPRWAIEIDNILVDIEDSSRSQNLRIME